MVDTPVEATSRDDTAVPYDGGDAQLVADVLAGDRDAMGDLYDRYADRIHTMCVHMLGDADEAEDVTGQVFLTALQRLHQLRDPAKLRSWLYAIARHEVYRRTKRRSRERPVDRIDDLASGGLASGGMASGGMASRGTASGRVDAADAVTSAGSSGERFIGGDEADLDDAGADPGELAALLQTAALGLDDRDRMVLELNLTQGLDGDELAAALGVKVDNAYQLTHRMKERLERSMSALLVVSAGRDLCADLDGVAKKWDGTYDVLWRKRFARHVDRCERCQKMRSKLPRAVLSGAALSQAAQAAVLAAPISIRRRVLTDGPAVVASETGRPWSSDGFPVDHQPRRRWRLLTGTALAFLLVVAFAGSLDTGVRSPDLVDPNEVEADDTGPAETLPLNPAPNATAGMPPEVGTAEDGLAFTDEADPGAVVPSPADGPTGGPAPGDAPVAPPPPAPAPPPPARTPVPPAGTIPQGTTETTTPVREPRDPQDPPAGGGGARTTTTTRPRTVITLPPITIRPGIIITTTTLRGPF